MRPPSTSRIVATVTVLAMVMIALLFIPALTASSTGGPPASTIPLSTTTTTTTTTTAAATSTTTMTTLTRDRDNPFSNSVMAAYLQKRTNLVTAAVYDVKSGVTFTYHNGVRERTASLVKIDILADLLYESQYAQKPLTAKQESLATSMIEDSNDKAASKLWADIGGRDDIDEFNDMIGFKNTTPSYSWGDIETTPLDQLQLLKVIVLPNQYLDAASRQYEMTLMEDVIGSQRFGVGWGSPGRATVGLKDGYYFEATTGWQLDTSGFVMYQGRFYFVTIMAAKNRNEEYGIDTLSTMSNDIWKYLKP